MKSCALSLLALLACVACGDDDGGGDQPTAGTGGGTPCVQGTSYECVARGGCAGRQRCGTDGFLLPCMCLNAGSSAPPPDDAGTEGDAAADGGPMSARDAAVQDGGDATPDAATQDAAAAEDEDCDNDVDDDGDGDADCADSDCTARSCVQAPPDGWSGPVLVDEGAGARPSCGGSYPNEIVDGGTALDTDPVQCSACTCSGGPGSCASALHFETGDDAACDNACTNAVNSNCALISPSCLGDAATGYVQSKAPNGSGAGCTPSAQSPTVPAASWEERARVCAPDAEPARAGCDAGEVCAPEAPFDGDLCIYRDGDVPCPSGPYDDRRVYYTGIEDSRSCSACQCGADCDYEWRIFDAADTTCATPVLTITGPDQCEPVTPASGSIRVGVAIPSATGACVATGGEPTGSVEAQNPITVCCL